MTPEKPDASELRPLSAPENDALLGRWLSPSGLYYLDVQVSRGVSYVLPNQSATLTDGLKAVLHGQTLMLHTRQSKVNLVLETSLLDRWMERCLILEGNKLCRG